MSVADRVAATVGTQETRMGGFQVIVAQAVAIVAVGAAIGVVDGFVLRPVKLGREAPPDIGTLLNTPAQPAAAPKVAPAAAGVATQTAPTTPAPAAAAGAFKPTPKDQLPTGQITLEEGKALFDRGAAFVDTRKAEEYVAGHVQGAFRVPLEAFKGGTPAILGAMDKAQPVVCYCIGGHCDESEQVAKMFSGEGFRIVYVLHDGFPGWKAMGYPVETGEGLQ